MSALSCALLSLSASTLFGRASNPLMSPRDKGRNTRWSRCVREVPLNLRSIIMARTIRNNPEARKQAAKRNNQGKVRRESRRASPEYCLDTEVISVERGIPLGAEVVVIGYGFGVGDSQWAL